MGIKISDKIVGKQIWNITNLSLKVESDEEAKEAGFPHSSLDNYQFDPETMDWQAWMYVGEVPENEESTSNKNVEWITIGAGGFKRLSDDGETAKQIETFKINEVKLSCDGNYCTPEQYVNLVKGETPPEFRFAQVESRNKPPLEKVE